MEGKDAIGYTPEGMVWYLINGLVDGKPFQTVCQWTPEDARKVANCLIDASNMAEKSIPDKGKDS